MGPRLLGTKAKAWQTPIFIGFARHAIPQRTQRLFARFSAADLICGFSDLLFFFFFFILSFPTRALDCRDVEDRVWQHSELCYLLALHVHISKR